MSQFSGMSPKARRAWGIGAIVLFAVMCIAIAISQWYAENVNVPRYQAMQKHAPHSRST
jgi:hypothetical protein